MRLQGPVTHIAGSPSASPKWRIWAHWMTLSLLMAACVAVRFVCLTCKPFWFDESFSVEVARVTWSNFLHLLWWREANMSLYYLLLRIWLHLGQSAFFIRSLSVIISAATLPAVYWLARLLFDQRVAVIAAALFTFNAYDVRYAQEARSYALFVLLATLSSGLLVSWLSGEPSRRTPWGYVIASVLAAYSHLYALLLVASHWLVLKLTRPSQATSESNALQLRRAWIAIAVAVSPLLVFVAKTGAGPIRWIQRPGLRTLFDFLCHLCGSESWPLAALYAAGCGVAAASAGKRLWRRDPSREVWRLQFLLTWFLFPILLTVVLSFARPVFLARYMIFCLPALVILAAAGLERLRVWWMLGIALAVMLLLSLQGVLFVYGHDFDNERDSSAQASDFILNHSDPRDAIIFHIAATRIPYEFARSLRSGQNTASPEFNSSLGPEILFPYHGLGLDYRDFTGKPTANLVRDAAATHSRIWLMLMNNGPPGNPDASTVMLTQLLPKYYPTVQCWQFAGVEVRLYSNQ